MHAKHWAMAAVVVVGTLTLGGCGGGGTPTGNGSPPDGDTPSGNGSPPDGSVSLVTPTATPTPELVHRAARAVPRSGSVTQGSSVVDGVTADSVSVKFVSHAQKPNGVHPVISMRTGDGTVMETNRDPTKMDVILSSGEIIQVDPGSDWESEVSSNYSYFPQEVFTFDGHTLYSEEFGSGGYECMPGPHCEEVERRRAEHSVSSYVDHPVPGKVIRGLIAFDQQGGGTFVTEPDGSLTVQGRPRVMAVYGYTDHATGQAEWLAWGRWSRTGYPNDDFRTVFGAFADGNMATGTTDMPVTGTATYSGFTSGMAMKGTAPADVSNLEGKFFEFVGRVALAADFSASTISGRVSGFRADGGYEYPLALVNEAVGTSGFLNRLEVSLGVAAIDAAPSDATRTLFEGATSASGLSGATGKWGGQFFGEPANGDAPPSVGGTWGVSQGGGSNDWKLLGGFGAWKD